MNVLERKQLKSHSFTVFDFFVGYRRTYVLNNRLCRKLIFYQERKFFYISLKVNVTMGYILAKFFLAHSSMNLNLIKLSLNAKFMKKLILNIFHLTLSFMFKNQLFL